MLQGSLNLATWLTRQVPFYSVGAIGRTTRLGVDNLNKAFVVLRLLARSGDSVVN